MVLVAFSGLFCGFKLLLVIALRISIVRVFLVVGLKQTPISLATLMLRRVRNFCTVHLEIYGVGFSPHERGAVALLEINVLNINLFGASVHLSIHHKIALGAIVEAVTLIFVVLLVAYHTAA